MAWKVRARVIPFGWREREAIAARQISWAVAAAGGTVSIDDIYQDYTGLKLDEDDDFLALAAENIARVEAEKLKKLEAANNG